jgi:5-methylcytosine-specific restriction endonuclease McrA
MSKRVLTEEQLQARREYAKKYREEHREKERERLKRWKSSNRERYNEIKRTSRKKNYVSKKIVLSEDEIEQRKQANKIKAREYARKYYADNFVSVEKVCKYCGNPFMTQYKKSKVFCSVECANKHEHYTSKLAEKRRKGKITALDRLDNDITLPLLFARDKGICKICGMSCDWSDVKVYEGYAVVGDNYPSIDHITPISKGGSHTWDNVQLTHFKCNRIKNDKAL